MPITFEDTKLPDTELFRQAFELSYAEMIAKHKELSPGNKEDFDTEYADNSYKFYIHMIDLIQNSGIPLSDHELAAVLLAPAVERRPELAKALDSETALAMEQERKRMARLKAAPATAEGIFSAIKTPAENVIARVYLIEEMYAVAHLCGTGIVLSDLNDSDSAIDMAAAVDGTFKEYDESYGVLKNQVPSPYLDEEYKKAVESLRSLISVDLAVSRNAPVHVCRPGVLTPKNGI